MVDKKILMHKIKSGETAKYEITKKKKKSFRKLAYVMACYLRFSKPPSKLHVDTTHIY